MSRKVALVGHCGPDSSYLRTSVGSIDRSIQVLSADDEQSLTKILADGADLLLVNRVLDFGFDDFEGVALISRLRRLHPDVPMMLVSNYAESQAAAVAAGALSGFGKRDLGSPRIKTLLKEALSL
jgi:CheY-like chemotaxis protein